MRRFVRQGQLPHLLFYGPPGTGKTSVALSLANEIYGGANKRISSVLELNASDERGIDVVRDQIKGFAGTKSLFMTSNESNKNAFKMIILDECDAMTSSAQNALRRVMERSVKNVRFVLICNYVGQIIPALQSRCTRFRFSPIPSQYLSDRLEEVVANESLEINPEAKESIVSLANGDMRRVLNVLQACASSSRKFIIHSECHIYFEQNVIYI